MEAKKEKLIELLVSNLGNISEATKAVGIARKTYYNWLESDQDFAESVNHINELVIDEVEHHLMTAIRNGNVTAQIFFLKTKAKHRGYVERQEIINSVVKSFKEMSDDELYAIIQQCN